jgi:hypothetical protein
MKWQVVMSDEEKPDRPEIHFLPPLKMVLAFFDREARKRGFLKKDDTKPVNTKSYDVKRIIDRLKDTDKKSD